MPFEASLQNIITTKWHFNNVDTTIRDKNSIYSGLSWDLLETENGSFYYVAHQYFGWTIEKIEVLTGKVLWRNGRHQNFPEDNGQIHLVDNIFQLKDKNIEILGLKAINKAPAPIFDGNPIRCIYDKDTGKEISFTESKIAKYPSVVRPGISRGFLKDGENYKHISSLRFQKDTTHYLRMLDKNLDCIDTLQWYQNPAPKKFKSIVRTLYEASSFKEINGNIYYLTFGWGKQLDTNLYQHLFTKIDKYGNIQKQKDFSKQVHYVLSYLNYESVSDGFVLSGFTDTTNNLFRNHNSASNTLLITHIDTAGNIKWKVSLKHPKEGEFFELADVVEDKERMGFWACAGAPDKVGGKGFLYFIDKHGNAKPIGWINLNGNNEDYYPTELWLVNKKDLILGYRYRRCETKDLKYCQGLSRIEGADLDKYITATKFDLNPENKIEIYPNPSDGVFNISYKNMDISGFNVKVYNSSGILVKNTNVSNHLIDLGDLTHGVYFIELEAEGKKYCEKVIKL